MRFVKAQVTNFRSIENSEVFEISDLTCLVGKNEAGKTALLKAIHGLAPSDSFSYERTKDYPRRWLTKYDERHPSGKSPVAHTWWKLDDDDVAEIEESLGEGALSELEVKVTSHIESSNTWSIRIDGNKCLSSLADRLSLSKDDRECFADAESTEDAIESLRGLESRTEAQESLLTTLSSFRDGKAVLKAVDILSDRMPEFFYTSHFERMSGELSINQLLKDKQNNLVSLGDQIFLDFLEYAGTNIEELHAAASHEKLVAQCEAASNDITDEIFEFWSQNEALAVKIEFNEGRPEDPAPFNSGRVAKIRIWNDHHRVSVPLSERSAGFVWFFSFLSQFKQLKKRAGNAIILLDEPGLTLHGKAQSDLLRYIEERILPEHQVIYSTHSPFMVPAQRLADVRVVEDVVDYSNPRRPDVKGTKVSKEILSVDKDTLFPLQAHLGYEITQSLFIGQNTLLVEGPSDIVYLQVVSQALKSRGRVSLDEHWAICPTGGLDKVSSFASLFSGNDLNIAVLCDYGKGDKGKVERLKESQILNSEYVLTAADFSGKAESDVEDLFAAKLYCELVNQSLQLTGKHKLSPKSVEEADPKTVRIVKQVEAACRTLPPDTPDFGHYVPADWLLRHPEILDGDSPEVNETLDKFEQAFIALNKFLP
ncbi:AAA family ATPase [Sedimenticola selenatireducens]|uniref:AAA family ATPase n=1 Tax=Sedimenticola selenatireducens TaxID=191960 RepID=UPI002AAC3D4C|nr:AAA family ATPase [Sedimenticola selenatireducens]